MVTRTAQHLVVSEENLRDAIDTLEAVLREHAITADIEVALEHDDEQVDFAEFNVLIVLVRDPVEMTQLVDTIPVIGERLAARGLLMPTIRLMFDVDPAW